MTMFLKKSILWALTLLMILPAYLAIGLVDIQSAEASEPDNSQLEQLEHSVLPNPVLISPAPLAQINTSSITFSWQPVIADVEDIVYDLQIDGINSLTSLTTSTVEFNAISLQQGPHTWAVGARYSDEPAIASPISPVGMFSLDTIAPVFTDNGLFYSAVYGESIPEQNVMAKKVAGRYVIPMSGREEYIYLNSMFGTFSEEITEQITPIYFANLSAEQKTLLTTYYSSEFFDDGSGEYFLRAIDGLVPITYLLREGNVALTIDAFVYSASEGKTIIPFAAPGNFPVGVYNFEGAITDIATNIGKVKFSIEFTRPGLILPAPTNLAATSAQTEVNLVWDEVNDAISYNVYYKKTSDSAYGNPINIVGTKATINGLEAGTAYDFMVSALSSQEVLGQSATVSATTISAPVITPPVVIPETITPTKSPVKKAYYPSSSIVAPASAAPALEAQPSPEVMPEIVPQDDEAAEEEMAETINWTPWLILFMLILLAGAATGAYFYWFGNDEDVQKDAASDAKPITTKPETVNKTNKKTETKSTGSKSKEGPPPKRW